MAEVFYSPRFGKFRAIRRPDDGVLFAASDMARCLGFRKPSNAVKNHCKEAVKVPTWHSLRIVDMLYIPMSDVERLAAVRLPPYYTRAESASPGEPFMDWVRESVATWDTELDWEKDHRN